VVEAVLHQEQGDQIGRIFAHWAIVYMLFSVFKNTEESIPHALATSLHGWTIILTKNGFGFILGDFSRKASRHPDFVTLISSP
jgi:hypothetical protein